MDLFLFDYKDSVAARLKENTGLSLRAVSANLQFLHEKRAAIILRCPIIPGSMTRRSISGHRRPGEEYVNLRRIEILPFHNLGVHKSARIGGTSSLACLPTTPREMTERWLALVSELGGKRIITG